MNPELGAAGLASLRREIDLIDEQMVALLAERFEVTSRVGILKKQMGLPAADCAREERQSIKYEALAVSHKLSPQLVKTLFRTIIDEVIVNHAKV